MVEIVLRLFSAYKDFPTECPLRKKRYDFLNVTINPDIIPPMMPDHTAIISVLFLEKIGGKRKNLAKVKFYVIIKRSLHQG
ncbi:hypothetical protein Bhyg_15921 [Pseudolycoriella hygida]|uniref:Uncharacterized protein n=1 Tax=Pseudolycoriella hygida TaxID=35572 RepID=A0A9Q0RUU0_9DIPT|nr:hypothetical protein Bhyg_15921 [Pseudolycoriella hygida]